MGDFAGDDGGIQIEFRMIIGGFDAIMKKNRRMWPGSCWVPTPFNNRWWSSSRKLRFRRWRVSSCCSAFAFAA